MSAATDQIDDIIQELQDALVAMAPEHEGLRDFDALNLGEPAQREISAAIADYDRRVQYINGAIGQLTEAKSSLQTLEADGYPRLDKREVVDAAYADLQANAATIQAALAKFSSGKAVGLGLKTGSAEPKP
jgi:hypothetical protein